MALVCSNAINRIRVSCDRLLAVAVATDNFLLKISATPTHSPALAPSLYCSKFSQFSLLDFSEEISKGLALWLPQSRVPICQSSLCQETSSCLPTPTITKNSLAAVFLMSGCRESNSDFMLPKHIYYHYTTPRYLKYFYKLWTYPLQ